MSPPHSAAPVAPSSVAAAAQEFQKDAVNQELRTALRHTAVYGLGTILAKAVGFLLLPLYTHYLTPRDYGTLEILDLTMSLIGMFLSMGIITSLLRFHNTSRTVQEKRAVVSTALFFVVVTGVATWCAAALLARPITTLLLGTGVPTTYFLISFTAFTFAYITNVPGTYIQAREASGTLVLTNTLALFFMLALNIYFIVFARLGLVGILWSSLLVGGVKMILFVAWMIRDAGIAFSWSRLREMMAFGAPLVVSSLAMFTLNFSDRFFLKHFQSLEAVGVYAVGYKFGFLLYIAVIQPFYLMWQARMYMVDEKPDREQILSRIFSFYAFVLLFAGLALSLFRQEVIRLMVDARFSASQSVIPIVALSYVVYGIGYFLQSGLLMTARTRSIGLLGAYAAGLNLLLNYALVPRFGMLGAAWATVLGFVVIAVGSCYLAWGTLAAHLKMGRFLKGFLLAGGLFLLSFALDSYSLATAILLKALLWMAFPVLLVFARLVSRDEMDALCSIRDRTMSFGCRIFRGAQRSAGV